VAGGVEADHAVEAQRQRALAQFPLQKGVRRKLRTSA